MLRSSTNRTNSKLNRVTCVSSDERNAAAGLPHYFFATALCFFCILFFGPPNLLGQKKIRVYPASLRIDKGKTRTLSALYFGSNGEYQPNQKLEFSLSSGTAATATVRPNPEGNTEDNNSHYSNNLAEITARSKGVVTITAARGALTSNPITVTVVDPEDEPLAAIKGDNDAEGGQTIHARVGQVIEVNGEASSGVADITWFWGDGDRTGDLLSAAHAYVYPGKYQLGLRIANSKGVVSESFLTVIVSGQPAATRTFTVNTLTQLLAAYNQCTGGENIVIPAGMVLSGHIELPARNFSDFVTIRSSASMPEMAVRVDPDRTDFAILRGAYPNDIPMVIKNRASKIRLSGLKFEPFPNSNDGVQNYYLLQIGEAFGQVAISDNPTNIILDHCVVDPPDKIQVVHAILNDGYKVSIISSWLGNIKTYGGQDSQAVFSLDGRGAHVYNNTYFEAASESIIYGGAGNEIEGNVPTNIEFRRCIFTKPLAWLQLPLNSFGDSLNEKNLFETKNARRVYVEGSLFSNHWDAGRSQHYAIILKSTADLPDSGQGSPWSVSEEITFENNRVSHMNGALSVAREFSRSGVEYDPLKPRQIRVLNTLFDDLTFGRWGTSNGWSFYIADADDVSIRHVSVIDAIDTPDEPNELLLALNSVESYRPQITDSILPLNYYGIRNSCGEGIAAMNVGTSGWFDTFSGGSCNAASGPNAGSWRIIGNVLPKMRTDHDQRSYPNGNYYPENYSGIGMRGYRNCNISPFVDPCNLSISDFSLRDDSQFKNKASDNTDPGINAALLNERLRCTNSGDTRTCVSAGLESDLSDRPTGDGLIQASDLALVRDFIVGNLVAASGTNEFQRIDAAPYATRGDGLLTAGDVVQARNYFSGAMPSEPSAGPASPIATTSNLSQQGPLADGPDLSNGVRTIRAVSASGDPGGHVSVAVQIDSQGDEAAESFTLNFDPTILSNPKVELSQPAPEGTVLTTNTTHVNEGSLGVLLDSALPFAPFSSTVQLMTVSFDVASNAPGGGTGITFTNNLVRSSTAKANGDLVPTNYQIGVVTISGPVAPGLEIGGRILSPDGRGIKNAQVKIVDLLGISRSSTSNSFGYYRFEGVGVGSAYTMRVSAKSFRFAPKVLQPFVNLPDFNFVGLE